MPAARDTANRPAILLERDRELDTLAEVIAAATTGDGGVAIVEGAPGIGKSALLDGAAREARERGLLVLRARPGELESELPWSVVRGLFAPLLNRTGPARRVALLDGAAGLAEPIVSANASPARSGPDALAAFFHGLYWLTANLADEQPAALIVDDAHWADAPSLHFLAYLGGRVADLPLALLFGSRLQVEAQEPARVLTALSGGARTLRLKALSEPATKELLKSTIGTPDREFTRACHECTGGNPFLVRELALELRREGFAPNAATAAAIEQTTPESVSRSVLLRLASLPEEEARLAQSVAVLGGGTEIALAAAVAEIAPDRAASAATRLARIEVLGDGLPLRFVHPIVRSVIYADIPAAQRPHAHARAASALAAAGRPGREIAAQVHAADAGSFEAAADVLRDAAREALSAGAPTSAVAHLRRALEERLAPELRAALLSELGEAEALSGDPKATERLEQALELLAGPRERADLLRRLGAMLYSAGRFPDAVAALDRGLEALGNEEPELATELRGAQLSIRTLLEPVSTEELESIGVTPERDPAELSAAEREVLTQLSLARVMGSYNHAEARELALRALGDGAMLAQQGVSLSFSVAASCLAWSDALAEAKREIDAALEHAVARGALVDAAYVLFGRSQVHYLSGRVGDAAADSGAAIDAWTGTWSLHLPSSMYWQAISLIELDDLDGAAEALDQGKLGDRSLTTSEAGMLASAGSRLALARGELDTAYAEVERIVDSGVAEIPFFRAPAYIPWRSDAAVVCARLGRDAQAQRFATEELELARAFGSARTVGVATRGAGIAAGGERGLELLRESVAVLDPSPIRLELCHSLVELGATLRRSGARGEAREQLREGLELASRLGATALGRRAQEELAASGARLRRRELSGPDSLTPSERRVAELAAAGTTNRQIAQQLFVSLRTIETHLTHAYGKLEIGSRAELAEALAVATDGTGGPA